MTRALSWAEEQAARFAWLGELKAGDEVGVRYRGGKARVDKVEKATPAQIVVAGQRYWKKNGESVGTEFHFSSLVQITQDDRDRNEAAGLRHELTEGIARCSLATLRKVKAAYDGGKAAEAALIATIAAKLK